MKSSGIATARGHRGIPSTPLAAGPSRRPLFLGARIQAQVDADGPALRVRASGRAEMRFPLARVSRVIASPHVNWSAEALRACLEGGIPIVIVGDDGAPLGSFHPAHARPCRLAESIEELLDRPDWRDLYASWLRSARMRVLADWRKVRQASGKPPGPGEFSDLARKYVYDPRSRSPFAGTSGVWRGALWAVAAEVIHRHGLQPVYWGAGDALHVLGDLAGLLELRLRMEVHKGMEEALEGEAVLVRVFHALSTALERHAESAIASLARWVKQVLAEWR